MEISNKALHEHVEKCRDRAMSKHEHQQFVALNRQLDNARAMHQSLEVYISVLFSQSPSIAYQLILFLIGTAATVRPGFCPVRIQPEPAEYG